MRQAYEFVLLKNILLRGFKLSNSIQSHAWKTTSSRAIVTMLYLLIRQYNIDTAFPCPPTISSGLLLLDFIADRITHINAIEHGNTRTLG